MVPDHNASRWLMVRYLRQHFNRSKHGYKSGWYVVRICPCHFGLPVTMPYETEERAERAMRLLIDVAKQSRYMTYGTE